MTKPLRRQAREKIIDPKLLAALDRLAKRRELPLASDILARAARRRFAPRLV